MSENIIHVIIANNSSLIREGIKYGLSKEKDISVIGQAENGIKLLEILEQLQPDIIIMDIRMPEMDALEALPIIKNKYPAIKVIIYTFYNNPNIIIRMIELGANSYLCSESGPQEIYQAIKECYWNKFFISEVIRHAFAGTTTPGYTGRYTNLEIRLLAKLRDGDTTNIIADDLDLSPRTILAIIENLKNKTSTNTTEALIEFGIKNKIIE